MKRSTTVRRRAALPAAITLGTLVLAGCGAANEGAQAGASETAGGSGSASASGEPLSGELNAVGASSITSAMEAWVAGFTEVQPDVAITYDPAGSGAGRSETSAAARAAPPFAAGSGLR